MVEVLARVKYDHLSGVPRDDPSTTWAFDAADLDPATLDGIADSIIDWHNVTYSTAPMAGFMASYISRATDATEISFYDISGALGGGPYGSPVRVVPFTLAPRVTGHQDLPEECAIRFTVTASNFRTVPETAPNPNAGQPGEPSSIRPRSRYRGGFYFPALTSLTMAPTTSSGVRVWSTFKTRAGAAWFGFLDTRPDFGIWSRRDAEVRVLVAAAGSAGLVEVDNAFDTIRRRGPRETSVTEIWP